MSDKKQSWEDLIINYSKEDKFKSRTCSIYNNNSKPPAANNQNKLCPCGRMIRSHSLAGDSLESKHPNNGINRFRPPDVFLDNNTHSAAVPINVFGTLKPDGCKFLRVDSRLSMKMLFQLMVEDCGKKKPDLILSVYGGAKYFTMTERLEKEFIRGLIDAATTANAWILTTGVNNGVSKLVGESISHYSLLREYANQVKCIGMTMWSSLNENMRLELKKASSGIPPPLCERQIPENIQIYKETIERNHTHCILFDSGRLDEYLSDSHRDQFVTEACKDTNDGDTCYAVTILVEGGIGSLEVLENDIVKKRPIVLIQGSGRLADVLAMLIEQTADPNRNQYRNPSLEEITQALDRFYPNLPGSETSLTKNRIQKILQQENCSLLHVFSINRDKNVAETIFKAIFKAPKMRTMLQLHGGQNNVSSEKAHDLENLESKAVKLALKWDYFDGVLPILEARQDEVLEIDKKTRKTENEIRKIENEMMKKEDEYMTSIRMNEKKEDLRQTDAAPQNELLSKKEELSEQQMKLLNSQQQLFKKQKELFLKSLHRSRSKFIEYFLISGWDPITLLNKNDINTYQKFIENLYIESYKKMKNKSHQNRVTTLFGQLPIKSIRDLDNKLNKFVGSFIEPIYSSDGSLQNRIESDSTRYIGTCSEPREHVDNHYYELNHTHSNRKTDQREKHYMLRDLFLWAVFMDMPEVAKILLFHLRSRICAALIASAIFKKYSASSPTIDMKDKFRNQSLEFETYAAMFTDKCYEYNEKRTCELLLRQIPLFGNVTCMQVAISSENGKLLQTASFDRTLNQVWFDKLALNNSQTLVKLRQVPAILTLGFLAPLVISYKKESDQSINNTNDAPLSQEGINYYVDEQKSKEGKWSNYWRQFIYFHQSSTIKLSYHFISYIWFLLVFSYMMLYHLDGRDQIDTPHWTEIYVIITVSTMLCEEIRKLYHEHDTRTTELWRSTESSILTTLTYAFYILPYFLFYLGLGFRYGSYSPGLLSTARIIWALDLELWYLRSLKFVMAVKSLGPKLFMLKNMLQDLFGFVYMIFIAIAAYGVVSRALILYDQVPFTGRGIFSEIFYVPYWFIYGTVTDLTLLDDIINNSTDDTPGAVAEATATHVLLAFHMLFINILILNLLIAVFAYTIGIVQDNTEFYWRYQRYAFVREYFECLPLSYPPLIIVSHIILLILTIYYKCRSKFRRNFQVTNEYYVPISKRFTRTFKMIPTKDSQNEQWDSFEHAATYSYARSILETPVTTTEETSSKATTTIDSNAEKLTDDEKKTIQSLPELMSTFQSALAEKLTDDQQKTIQSLPELMSPFQSALAETQKELKENNTKTEHRLDQIDKSLEWIMKAIERVKMNNPQEPRPTLESS